MESAEGAEGWFSFVVPSSLAELEVGQLSTTAFAALLALQAELLREVELVADIFMVAVYLLTEDLIDDVPVPAELRVDHGGSACFHSSGSVGCRAFRSL